jgi:hypothetical protein
MLVKKTYKRPRLKRNININFCTLGSCRRLISLIGKAMMAISVMMANADVEYHITAVLI